MYLLGIHHTLIPGSLDVLLCNTTAGEHTKTQNIHEIKHCWYDYHTDSQSTISLAMDKI